MSIKRFIEADPLEQAGRVELYAYASNAFADLLRPAGPNWLLGNQPGGKVLLKRPFRWMTGAEWAPELIGYNIASLDVLIK